MLIRLLTLTGLLAAVLGNSPAQGDRVQSDGVIVQGAALRLGREPAPQVLRWLSRQGQVNRATIGRDGHTVEIDFRDGARSVVLAPLLVHSTFVGRDADQRFRPERRFAAPGSARALVLEPFAAELNLPPGAGTGEVSDLTSAGFRADGPLTDSAVTPSVMATLAQYNVVYMHTHTGVDQNGSGVLATGEPASCAPYISPDGTIVTVGVAGSTQCFHAITAAFVRKQVGRFPTNAIVYVNGCDLLDAADFLQAFSDHGVGVTLSWNGEATGFDGYLSSLALFNQLGQGMTVSQALTTLYANHYGTSQTQGHTATLGYKGNGSITLQQAAAGGTGSPAPTTTATASPTETPANTTTTTPIIPSATPFPTIEPTRTATPLPTNPATPAPTATAQAMPVASLLPIVKPGNDQTVSVLHLIPGSTGTLSVQFPNGDVLHVSSTADAGGSATLRFAQSASKLTRHNQTALVMVMGDGPGGSFVLHAQFHLAFGRIDVSAQPRKPAAGHVVTIWVHAPSRTAIVALVKLSKGHYVRLYRKTGTQGWAELSYRLKRTVHHGQKVVIQASYQAGKKHWHSATSVQVA